MNYLILVAFKAFLAVAVFLQKEPSASQLELNGLVSAVEKGQEIV